MKLKKSQLKELVKQALVSELQVFGSKAQYDAYRKKTKIKPGTKVKVDGKITTVRGSEPSKMSKSAKATADRMADLEKKRKQGKIKESTKRRCTVKEVKLWMKTLEENRYKKTYNSDARRVAWMVNNEGIELTEMPKSMIKKWTKAQYGRERYLAKEFIKSKSKQMNESKLRDMIREIIKEQLNEAPKPIHHSQAKFTFVPKKDIKKVEKMLMKKFPPKGGYHRIEIAKKTGRVPGHFAITFDKSIFNDALELLMKNKIKTRG